jgi:hypothetical protein
LKEQPGVVVEGDLPNGIYPRSFETAGKDSVFAGRMRKDLSVSNGIAYWVGGWSFQADLLYETSTAPDPTACSRRSKSSNSGSDEL